VPPEATAIAPDIPNVRDSSTVTSIGLPLTVGEPVSAGETNGALDVTVELFEITDSTLLELVRVVALPELVTSPVRLALVTTIGLVAVPPRLPDN
jgi:hypothetical protein